MDTRFQTRIRTGRRAPSPAWVATSLLPLIAITGLVLAGPADVVAPTMPSPAGPRVPHNTASVHVGLTAAQSCAQCHRLDAASSHPVDVVPSMPIPAGLPLLAGKLTCATCHTTPTSAEDRPGPWLLRDAASGVNLCTSCHTGPGPARQATNGIANHAVAPILAHPTADPSAARSAPRAAVRGTPEFDRQTRSCLSCHDGSLAGDGGAHGSAGLAAGQSAKPGPSEEDHPMGVPYDDRRPTNAEVRLTPRASLNPSVPLFNQAVGCGSCHNVYSKQPKLLVMSNTGSRLCLACHVQ